MNHMKKHLILLLSIALLLVPSVTVAQDDLTAGDATELILQHYRSQLASTTDWEPSTTTPIVFDDLPELPDLPPDEFYRAKISNISNEEVRELFGGYVEQMQEVEVTILNGPDKGSSEVLLYGGLVGEEKYQKLEKGDTVVVVKNYREDGASYFITEHYRITPLLFVLLFFVVLALFFGRKKGLGSILGLGFSIFVLTTYIVPKIVAGSDPLLITLSGTFLIAAVSLFLAHGFNRRTTIAFSGTMITLMIAWALSEVFVRIAHLFGEGTEHAFYLQMGGISDINLRGLLLAGIVIGTLGVLDDITTAQTAVVGELRQANPSLPIKELYNRALIVGREHIASLVNTLVLAYAGSSLPLFILFAMNKTSPWWVTLNSEMIAEEIVRTIIGSSALILAVPITSLLAAYYLQKEKLRPEGSTGHHHHH